MEEEEEEVFRVAVVGGGLAGILAARLLSNSSQFGKKTVVVLEAASRLGGRIQNVSGLVPWPVEVSAFLPEGVTEVSVLVNDSPCDLYIPQETRKQQELTLGSNDDYVNAESSTNSSSEKPLRFASQVNESLRNNVSTAWRFFPSDYKTSNSGSSPKSSSLPAGVTKVSVLTSFLSCFCWLIE